jgi:hypothetical protein
VHRTVIRLTLVVCWWVSILAILAPGPALAARQGGPGPTFSFNPVYAGKNNGDAIGAVGSSVSLHVSGLAATGFTPSTTALIFVQPLSSVSSTIPCGSSSSQIAVGSIVVPADNFTYPFIWPAAATKSNAGSNGLYAACIAKKNDNSIWFYSTNASAVASPGTFTVTTDAPASLDISTNAARLGDQLIVTGKNWSPIYYGGGLDTRVTVYLGLCNTSTVLVTDIPTVAADGTFSSKFTIPDTASFATYQACASTNGNAQVVDSSQNSSQTPPSFQVIESVVTPTVTSTPSITPTPLVSPSIQIIPTPTPPTKDKQDFTLPIMLTLIALILFGGALLFFMLAQRRPPQTQPSGVINGTRSSPAIMPPVVQSQPLNTITREQIGMTIPTRRQEVPHTPAIPLSTTPSPIPPLPTPETPSPETPPIKDQDNDTIIWGS